MTRQTDQGSFRDPSGHVYYQSGKILRQVNFVYQPNYEELMRSGLYDELIKCNLLVNHRELGGNSKIYQTIEPDIIPFISYPYEWCFSQLKSAALLTLEIQKLSLRYNMSLKDASAFNVQFIGHRPVFIDTLSFEKYISDHPWIAYRQFCRHFLAPLALMAYQDIRLNKLLGFYLDGIPLDLTAKLLPLSAKTNLGILGHLIFNATSQQLTAAVSEDKNKYKLSKVALGNLIESLITTVTNLKPKRHNSTWRHYYSNTNYQADSFGQKGTMVTNFIQKISPKSVLDLGANNGLFSGIAAKTGGYVISADYDEEAVEDNYNHDNSTNILPLIIDFLNPTANLGWGNLERKSFWDRLHVDVIMMLATIHHLAIANNLPFAVIASLIRDHCHYLIIEFVGKQDSQVQILLSHREDIFTSYDQANFETEFGKYFKIIKKESLANSHRCLYLMEKK